MGAFFDRLFTTVVGFIRQLLHNPWVLLGIVVAIFLFGFQNGQTSVMPTACPINALQASKLFGGQANAWTEVTAVGWTTTNTARADRRINVPAWYSRVLTIDGVDQTFGAVIATTRVNLETNQSLLVICPEVP